jgi:hypothetical protein
MLRVLGSAAAEVRDVARAATVTHRRLRDRLVAVVVATIGLDLICAVAAFFAERHTPQSDIKSLGSAFFWTSTQLLTVSSSFKNPVSFGGRALDVFMEAYAITVIATLAGSVGAFFQKRGEERADEEAARHPRVAASGAQPT